MAHCAYALLSRHRQAGTDCIVGHEPPDAVLGQLSRAEQDALLAWLTTPPTTLAGVIATLSHASSRLCNNDDSTNLLESAQYSNDILAAGEQFPAMIAAALRQIVANKLL